MQFKNYGIDGFTIARVLENIRLQRIPLHRSPIITLLIGVNDIGLMMNTDRTEFQKKQMMQDFVAHYKELLKLLTRDARQVILMEPNLSFLTPKNIRHGFLTSEPCPLISNSSPKSSICLFCHYMITLIMKQFKRDLTRLLLMAFTLLDMDTNYLLLCCMK